MTPPPLSVRLAAATTGSRELNAEMARTLGWRTVYDTPQPWIGLSWLSPDGALHGAAPPEFTSSLDAITAEIERRGLAWEGGSGKHTQFTVWREGDYSRDPGTSWRRAGSPSPPVCLCLALLRAIGAEG